MYKLRIHPVDFVSLGARWWINPHSGFSFGIVFSIGFLCVTICCVLCLVVYCFSYGVSYSLVIDDALKTSVSCRLQITPMSTCGVRTNWPNRRHQCGTRQEPSEDQVNEWEIFKNSIVRELGIFSLPEKSGGLVLI